MQNNDLFLIQNSASYENQVFVTDEILGPNFENAVVVVKKLPDSEKDDIDQNNAGFEKLSGEGNKLGLFLCQIREKVVVVIRKKKVCY